MPEKKYSAEFKSRVALEAIREQKTLAELSKEYDVSVDLISLWKQEAIRNMDMLFDDDGSRREIKKMDAQIKALQARAGELTMERDFLAYACKMAGRKKGTGNL